MKTLLIVLGIILLLIGYCAVKGLQVAGSIVDTISDAPIKADVHSLTNSYKFESARSYLEENKGTLSIDETKELRQYVDSIEQKYIAFRATNLEAAKTKLKILRAEKDDFENLTWYRDKSSPRYTNLNGFYAYFAIDPDFKVAKELRLAFQYSAQDWIFFDKISLNIDGERIDFQPYQVQTMVDDGGKILEYFDQVVTEESRNIIEKIIASSDCVIRLYGKEGTIDKKLTNEQRTAFSNVLAAYDLLSLQI